MAKPDDDPPEREPPESDRTSLEDFQRLIDDIDAAAPSAKGKAERLDQVLGMRPMTGFQEPPTKLRNPFSPPTTKNQRKRRPTLEGLVKPGPRLPPPIPIAAPAAQGDSAREERAALRALARDDSAATPALPRAPGLPATVPEPSFVPPRDPPGVPPREPQPQPHDGRVLVRAAGLRRRESQPSQSKPPASPPPPPPGPRVPATRPLSRPSPRPEAGLLARAAAQAGPPIPALKPVPSARAGSQQSDPELRAVPAASDNLGAADASPSPERAKHGPSGSLVHVRRTTDPRTPRVTGTEGGARVHPAVLARGSGPASDAPPRGTPAPEPLDLDIPPGGTPTVTEPVPESLLESAAHLGPDLWFRPRPPPALPIASARLLDALTLVVLFLFFEAAALPTAAGPPWELLVRPTDPSFVGGAALILAAVAYFLPLRAKTRAVLNGLGAALVIPVVLALVGLAVARDTFDAQPALGLLFAGPLLAPISLLAAFVLLPAGLFTRVYAPRSWVPTGLIGAGVAALALGLIAPGASDAPLVAHLFDSIAGSAALGDQVAAIATLPLFVLALAALYCAIPGRGTRIAGPLGIALWVALALPLGVLALFVASGDSWTLVLEPFKIATLMAAAALYGAVATTQIVRVATSRTRASTTA